MADTFCLLLTQWRWTRNSLLLCLDWGTKIVFVRWGKVLPLLRKRCQLEGRREKDFYNFMYSGLLQDKDLILYQLLKMVVHALLALPVQVLAVELEDQCSAAKTLLMLFFFLIIMLPLMSLFLFGDGESKKRLYFYPVSFFSSFPTAMNTYCQPHTLNVPLLEMPKAKGLQQKQVLEFFT